MLNRINEKLKTIQEAERPIRRRWLIILSSISMMLVVGLWMGYISLIIPSSQTLVQTTETIESNDRNFLQTFGAGLKFVGEQAREKGSGSLETVQSKLQQKNIIIVDKKEQNFILETLEPVEPTHLP